MRAVRPAKEEKWELSILKDFIFRAECRGGKSRTSPPSLESGIE